MIVMVITTMLVQKLIGHFLLTKEESYAKWLGTALPKSIGKEKKEGFCRWFEPMPGYQGAVWTGKQEEIEIQWV